MSSFFLNSPVGRRATFAVEDSCWEQAGSTLTAVRSPSPPYCTAVVCRSPPPTPRSLCTVVSQQRQFRQPRQLHNPQRRQL